MSKPRMKPPNMSTRAPSSTPAALTEQERIAFEGLQAREREALAPIARDRDLVFRSIEQRLSLREGSLGSDYLIVTDDWTVRSRLDLDELMGARAKAEPAGTS